jgi:carboxypeptidase PM20D1
MIAGGLMLPVLFFVLSGVVILLMAVILLVIIRTLLIKAPGSQPAPINLSKVNGLDLAANLAEIIQCKTISYDSMSAPDTAAFLELHSILEKNYPLVHQHLQLEKVNGLTLLFTWHGKQKSLEPVLFAAHQDVVPIDQSSLSEWPYPPFSGAIAEGFVWGRGTMDIKCQMTTLLDSVEHLLKQGYQPRRTIYLAFGHDEEIGGSQGAAAIKTLLQEREIRLAAVIDEGGGVIDGAFPGINTPLSLIGTAEKGGLTLELSVESSPGHSSAPPAHTSIGTLAKALTRLEQNPLPASLTHIRPLLLSVAPYSNLVMRMIFANLWLFGGIVRRALAANPTTNALLRTTTAITMIEGGIKSNILPPKAAAQVNFRLLPNISVKEVIDHTRRVIADPEVKINQPLGEGRPASPISSTSSQAYALLGQTIHQVFKDIPVCPFLVTGATDSRHYAQICSSVYRFSPFTIGKDEMGRVHGIAERISIQNLENMMQFFVQLIQSWGSAQHL